MHLAAADPILHAHQLMHAGAGSIAKGAWPLHILRAGIWHMRWRFEKSLVHAQECTHALRGCQTCLLACLHMPVPRACARACVLGRRYAELMGDLTYIDSVLAHGAEAANITASRTLADCRDAMGFVPPFKLK